MCKDDPFLFMHVQASQALLAGWPMAHGEAPGI